MLFVNLGILLIGFVALIKGADFFVDGSAALAKSFGIPSVIVGLTIVALGTSAPELAVSTSAALQGSNEIALSNVVGSNIFNVFLILGLTALIRPVAITRENKSRDIPIMILTTVLLVCFGSDLVYSLKVPNTGEGITDYTDYKDTSDLTQKIEVEQMFVS